MFNGKIKWNREESFSQGADKMITGDNEKKLRFTG